MPELKMTFAEIHPRAILKMTQFRWNELFDKSIFVSAESENLRRNLRDQLAHPSSAGISPHSIPDRQTPALGSAPPVKTAKVPKQI